MATGDTSIPILGLRDEHPIMTLILRFFRLFAPFSPVSRDLLAFFVIFGALLGHFEPFVGHFHR